MWFVETTNGNTTTKTRLATVPDVIANLQKFLPTTPTTNIIVRVSFRTAVPPKGQTVKKA